MEFSYQSYIMEGIQTIPKEILCIIPKYDGDEKLLNLFISKCEYVLDGSRVRGNATQELYLFHSVSSKLTGRAASLLSDNPHITSWERLKEILTQHFGDPRSEECIAIELETMKLKQSESYIQFCQRIQATKSALVAKVNRLTDEGVKAAKMIIYNNTALNIFLYNLPEDLIRIVRLKGCSSLENALSIVTEEVNFQFQYSAKNKLVKQNTIQPSSSQNALRPLPMFQGFKPAFGAPPPNNNFRFGIPQNNNFKYGVPTNQGFRPNFVQSNKFEPPQGQFGQNQMQSYRMPQGQFGQNQTQRNFGLAPFRQPRAPFQHNGFRYGIPQQQGYKFGIQNQPQSNPNQFKFGIPSQQQAPRMQESDISMRTAPVRQNMLSNDLYYMEEPSYCQEYNPETSYDNDQNLNETCEYVVSPPIEDCHYLENYVDFEPVSQEHDSENFQETASKNTAR